MRRTVAEARELKRRQTFTSAPLPRDRASLSPAPAHGSANGSAVQGARRALADTSASALRCADDPVCRRLLRQVPANAASHRDASSSVPADVLGAATSS